MTLKTFSREEMPEKTWPEPVHPGRTDRISLHDFGHDVGATHRAGWDYALRALEPIVAEDGIFCDDFVERTFCYQLGRRRRPVYEAPWIGFFHHPSDMPDWAMLTHHPQTMLVHSEFRRSAAHLKLGIAVSQHVADFYQQHLAVPFHVVKHPTEFVDLKWTPDNWRANPDRGLYQVGWFMRNTRLIHQVPNVLPRYRLNVREFGLDWERAVKAHWRRDGSREEHGHVRELPRTSNNWYDELLSQNVVCMEVFAAGANNVTIECIVRETPLIVNRLPAIEEYLGPDYPLYFETPEQVAEMALDEDLILRAHQYLAELPKSPFLQSEFRTGVSRALASLEGIACPSHG